MTVSLMLVLSVLGAARARPEMRTPKAGVAVRAPVPKPAFSFAPLGGQGMGAACACTNPTGSRDEAISFSRASVGYCNKHGLGATGISNGDLVACASGEPRIQPAVANGPLGLLSESAVQNTLWPSESLSTNWILTNSGCSAATKSDNAAVAPDGATTAEQLNLQACSAGTSSYTYNSAAFCPQNANTTFSFYAKAAGVGDEGTLYYAVYNGSAWSCNSCVISSSSWSRCSKTLDTSATATAYVAIGNYHHCSGSSFPAKSVYVWGYQCEIGSYATSYVQTTVAAASRAADKASFTVAVRVSPGSAGASTGNEWTGNGPFNSGAYSYLFDVRDVGGGNGVMAYNLSGDTKCSNYNGPDPVVASATVASPGRVWCSADNAASTKIAGRAGSTDLTVTDNVGGANATSTKVRVGAGGGGADPGSADGNYDAVIYNVCVDSNPARCQ